MELSLTPSSLLSFGGLAIRVNLGIVFPTLPTRWGLPPW
jgi:hypothetical protein